MGEEEGRLLVLEEQIKNIGRDVIDVKATMTEIAKSLAALAVLEVRHNNTADSLSRAFRAIEHNNERLDKIEKTLPNLTLATSWVFKGVIATVSIIGGAVSYFMLSLIKK